MRNSAIRIVLSKLNRSNTSNSPGIQCDNWVPLASWNLTSSDGKFADEPNCLMEALEEFIDDVLHAGNLDRWTDKRLGRYSVLILSSGGSGDVCLAHYCVPLDADAVRLLRRAFDLVHFRSAQMDNLRRNVWLEYIYGSCSTEVG